MEFEKHKEIPDLTIVKLKAYEDNRGFFEETYNQNEFKQNGIDIDWVQSNHSFSHKDVVRGMHWQKEPYAQDKLVWVSKGTVLDVAVDIRKDSPTYGKYATVELSGEPTSENHRMFLIPKGFAHGFVVLSEEADFHYQVSSPYNKESERAMRYNDPDININWQVENPELSDKDLRNPFLKDIPSEDLF